MSLFGFDSNIETGDESVDDFQRLNATFSSIISAAGFQVPAILPTDLSFKKHLGRGNSFDVTYELISPQNDRSPSHHVAVKHVVRSPDINLQQRRNASIARELRVLTTPALRGNSYILSLLGYGWDESALGRRPYVIVEYSEHGTLSDYLQQTYDTITTTECRELALDVALGLQAIHDNKIIHGDIKPENILIFSVLHEDRLKVAKLADFGGSLFEEDQHEQATYGGTPLYNAPEQESRGKYNASDWRALEHFYLADVWSFGLTLWEIMRRGESYIDGTWLSHGQTKLDFLDQVASVEENGILQRARISCAPLFEGQTVLESSVLSTFTLTLMDDPYQRSNMSQIVNTLSQRCTRRPTANRVQTSIDSSPASEQESLSQEDAISSPGISPFQTLPISQARFAQKVVVAGIFGSVRTLQTHWEIQCNVFNDLSNSVNSKSSYRPSLTYYSNCLHLALTYHVGFGVRPDNSSTVRYLGMSALGNYVAEALYHRVSSSIDEKPRFEEIGWPLFTSLDKQLKDCESDETYFKRRIILLQQTWASETLLTLRNSDDDVSTALNLACQNGQAKEAVELCARCPKFNTKPSQPTPVHWLIMFDDQEAYRLSSALINGLSGNTSGPCRDCLNFSPTITEHDLFYPEHCLELGGTPLHWAVKTRNRALVQSLLSLGADPNIRWANPARTLVDRENPSLSALDIAVKFHLYEIVELLLDYGADRSTSPHDTLDFHHSALHCIGLPCVPLARRVIHGMHYRAALKKTIHILLNRGFDVNDPTPEGDTPLIVALRWSDCEEYIIEELLAAGARTTSIGLNNISNAAVAATKACISRRYSVANLRRVAPLVGHHINDLDEFGRNALHYAAGIAASGEAVQIISEVEGFDPNVRSSNGLHAIYYAALFDCCDAIPILVAHGVDIDAPVVNKNFGQYPFTALMSAAGRKNKKMTDSLLRYGANPNFSFLESPLYSTVLAAACARPDSEDSILKYLLDEHPNLRNDALLNATDSLGWTVLHKAACDGDVEGVEALLHYGANHAIRDTLRRTALDRVTEVLTSLIHEYQLSKAPRHWRVVIRGPQAYADFKAALERTKELLEECGQY
ncbi:hypothetical protein M434DRAFT_35754 [Hypoxylon sp. CO27-5]|nr:hypothetical protein M434DRAFT_35754 [Hypoxylon sp. CO27-5]